MIWSGLGEGTTQKRDGGQKKSQKTAWGRVTTGSPHSQPIGRGQGCVERYKHTVSLFGWGRRIRKVAQDVRCRTVVLTQVCGSRS